MEKKYWIILLILAVVLVSAWTLPIFPSEEENVTLVEWARKKIGRR